jgi:hypothetical protein
MIWAVRAISGKQIQNLFALFQGFADKPDMISVFPLEVTP